MEKVEVQKKKSHFSDKKKKDYLFAYGMIAYPFLVWALFFLATNTSAILMAFQKLTPDGKVDSFYLGNFRDAWNLIFHEENSLPMIGFKNSLKYWFFTQVCALPITFIFSYLIYKKIPCFRLMRILMMVPSMISGFVMIMVMKFFINGPMVTVFHGLGMDIGMPLRDPNYTNGILIFYTVWSGFGGSCLIYSNAMKEIDPSIIESSKLDGVSGMWKEIWYVCLPGIFPTFTTALISVAGCILTLGGPLMAFYMYNAPSYTYSFGYWMTLQTYTVTDYSGYPILTATGFMLSAVTIPVVYLVRWLVYKYGPSED